MQRDPQAPGGWRWALVALLPWVKGAMLIVAVWFLFIVGFLFFLSFLSPGGYVSASAVSPDGRIVAEIYEPPRFIDRNFIVRVKTEGQSGKATYIEYFRSPDEGFPPTERLLWSKDGRYLLVVGERASLPTVRNEACLPSGACLYLLVDTQKSIVYSNTIAQTTARDLSTARGFRDLPPFSVEDLSSINFGESFPSVSQ